MAQCIYISLDMTYSQLRCEIEKEFEVVGKTVIKRLAYWLPIEMSLFCSAKIPLVSINNDSGLATFLKMKASSKPAVVNEQSDGEQEIQPSVTNIYHEILEADFISAPDCEPCFGDELLQTQGRKMDVFDPANDAIYLGRVFRNKADMQTSIAIYAIKRVFNFRQIKSDKDRLIIQCVDNNCPWRVYGHIVADDSASIDIRTIRLTHTCNVQTRAEFGKKATTKVVAQVLRSKYSNGKTKARAAEIPAIVLDEMKVSISYMRGWHAKEKAITQSRETKEGSYNLLMAYFKLLKKTNEGTVTDVVCTNVGTPKAKFK